MKRVQKDMAKTNNKLIGHSQKRKTAEDIIHEHSSICWYPSAGGDFRALLFLSRQYCEWKGVDICPEELPDLFVMSDCDHKNITYTGGHGLLNVEVLNAEDIFSVKCFDIYSDIHTTITASGIQVLNRLNIPCDDKLYGLSKSENYGCAFLFKAHISSKQLGEWDADVLYLLVENTGFALRYLLPNRLSVDYIVCVRYGSSFGGSGLPGKWLLKLIPQLNVRYYLSNKITDDSFDYIPELLCAKYPEFKHVWSNTEEIDLKEFYCIDGTLWSNQGDIHCYKRREKHEMHIAKVNS